MMSVVIYEVLFLMVSFLYLVVTSHDIYIQMDIVCQVIGMRTVVTAAWGMLVYLEAMIGMGCFQFYLSLIMHPVLAILVTLTLLICACYFYMPLFPCSLMMLTRTCQVDRNGSFLLSGSIILTIISVILVWRGANFMKNVKLAAGEKQTIICPFLINDTQFTEKDWKNLNVEKFSLVLSYYPKKIMLSK